MTVTPKDIRLAAELISGKVVETPCSLSRKLSHLTGAQVVLKLENRQFTGSFKDRGALVKLLSLTKGQRDAGVIAMSAGNHAQAVAYHAQSLDIPSVIVMPRFTPNIKVERTRSFGAEVILHGQGLDDASAFTQTLIQQRGLHLIHPYDDEQIIAGQGTIAIEMLSAFPDLDMLVVPVGGGGLISGNAIAAKSVHPNIEIIGVQASRFPAMLQAIRGERIVCGSATIAEGIAVNQPGQLTLPIVRELVDEILVVDEEDIEEAVRLLLEMEKTVVEGAGAAGLAAIVKYPHRFRGRQVGLILCGGNIDLLILSSIIQRGLVRSGRLVRLRVEVRDVPGALAEVTKCLGEVDANIVEVQHQRAFTSLPLQSADVEFVLMTRGLEHLQKIIKTLDDGGFNPSLLHVDTKAPIGHEPKGTLNR
jgi:threonine dehydratase